MQISLKEINLKRSKTTKYKVVAGVAIAITYICCFCGCTRTVYVPLRPVNKVDIKTNFEKLKLEHVNFNIDENNNLCACYEEAKKLAVNLQEIKKQYDYNSL